MATTEKPTLRDWVKVTPARELTVWASPDTPVKLKVPAGSPPRYVLGKLMECRTNEFFMRPVSLDLYLKKRTDFCQLFGMEISDEVLDVLIEAGFVQVRRPTPFSIWINIESLFAFLNESASANYWTRDRRLDYLTARDNIRERRGSMDGRELARK